MGLRWVEQLLVPYVVCSETQKPHFMGDWAKVMMQNIKKKGYYGPVLQATNT